MFYQNDTQLLEEVLSASDAVQKMADAIEVEIAAFTGHAFDGSIARPNPDYLENHAYEYISLVLPRIVFDVPRVVARTSQSEMRGLAQGIQLSLNQLMRKTNFRQSLIRLGTDFIFSFGIGQTSMEPAPGYEWLEVHDPTNEKIKFWPKLRRVSLRRYFRDTLAEHWSEAQFFGHWIITNKGNLEELAQNADEDEGWNAEAIASLPDETDRSLRKSGHAAHSRKEVQYFEVWVRDYLSEEDEKSEKTPDKGYHGSIFTLAQGSADKGDDVAALSIRKPRAYRGPASGPYAEMGAYCVPDDSFMLSPLMATRGQNAELNKMVRGMNASANSYKRLILCDSSNGQLIRDIADKPHDFVIPIKGFDKTQVIPLEIGGITSQMVAMSADARDRLDRISGLSDAMRGTPQVNIKATADAIAAEAGAARLEFLKSQFTEGVTAILRTMAWHIATDDRFSILLGEEANEALGVQGSIRFVGSDEHINPEVWEAIDIEIEPFSMDRTTSALNQRRQLEALTLVVQLIPVIAAFPDGADWKTLVGKIGDATNNPDLGKIIKFNPTPGGGGGATPNGTPKGQGASPQAAAGASGFR